MANIWTDPKALERLETLCRQSVTFADIAKILSDEFGETVSRNAVIGKAHRLRLTKDAMPKKLPQTRLTWTPAMTASLFRCVAVDGMTDKQAAAELGRIFKRKVSRHTVKDHQRQLGLVKARRAKEPKRAVMTGAGLEQPASDPAPKPEPIPVPIQIGVADLLPRMCRWPVGDPMRDDFTFCGRARLMGKPYCPDHVRIAYRPIQDRKLPWVGASKW